MRYFVLVIMIFLCFSCSQPEQEDKINEQQIEQFFKVFSIYIDSLDVAKTDSVDRDALLDSILATHKMNRQIFDSTRLWLEANPETFQTFFTAFDDSMRAVRASEKDVQDEK